MAATLGAASGEPSLESILSEAGQNQDQRWNRIAHRLVYDFRSRSRRTIEAFLSESWLFDVLDSSDLGDLRVARTWEAAPTDLVLFKDDAECPRGGGSSIEILRWLHQKPGVPFLTLDVKTIQFRPINHNLKSRSGHSNVAYKWSDPGGRGAEDNHQIEVIIVIFEGIGDYLAVMPTAIFEAGCEQGYGLEPLLNKIPAWCQIFIVHIDDIGEALQRAYAARDPSKPYINPTTEVVLDGWSVYLTTDKWLLSPQSPPNALAMLEAFSFKRRVEASGTCRVDMNPIQPLICDFIVDVKGKQLCFEAKSWGGGRRSIRVADEPTHDPFAPGRQWHYLLFGTADARELVVIPRNRVKASWVETHRLNRDDFDEFYYGPRSDDIQRLLRDIEGSSAAAVASAQNALQDLTQAGNAALLSSGARLATLQLVDSEDVPADVLEDNSDESYASAAEGGKQRGKSKAIETKKKRLGKKEEHFVRHGRVVGSQIGTEEYLKYLPWLSPQLNQWACSHGYGLFFPLPDGHTAGTHVMVDYTWTPDDQDTFSQSSELPHLIFSPKLKGRQALVLRFADVKPAMSVTDKTAWPAFMTRAYWLRPGLEQHFIFVGNLYESVVAEDESFEPPYWCFPSEFLVWLDQGRRPPNDDKVAQFILRMDLEAEKLLEPPLAGGRKSTPISRGSAFLNHPARNVNPGRYVVESKDGALYHQLSSILQCQASSSIRNAQSDRWNRNFDACKHKAPLLRILQATWDFGLLRRPKRLNKDD